MPRRTFKKPAGKAYKRPSRKYVPRRGKKAVARPAAKSYRRYKAAGKPKTVTQRVSSTYSSVKSTSGAVRRYTNNSFQAKLLSMLTSFVRFRFGAARPWKTSSVTPGDGGAFWMWNQLNGVNQVQALPLHIYDITGAMQSTGNACAPGQALYKQLNRTMPGKYFTGRLDTDFNTVNGQPSTMFLQVESMDNSSATTVGANAILKWFKVDMLLRGKANAPTRFFIDMVQLNPDVIYGTKGMNGLNDWPSQTLIAGGGSATVASHADITWDKLTHHIVGNPISRGTSMGTYGGVKFIKRWSFTLDADKTNDMDANPVCKRVSIFHRFNRKCNYDWHRDGQTGGVYPQGNFADTSTPQVELHPRARVYLMVRADTGEYNGDTPSTVYMPSYDMHYWTHFLTDGRA